MANSNAAPHMHLGPDGVFANGVSVAAVIRFIRAQADERDAGEVAERFGLDGHDVMAAVVFHARHFDWVHPLVRDGEG